MNKYRWTKLVYALLVTIAILSLNLFISRNSARQNAIQECNSFRLVAEEQLSNIHIQISTYGSALKISPISGELNFFDAILPVWVVDLDGKWRLSGGPAPVEGQPELEPRHFDHCTVFVNVFTGQAFHLQVTPEKVDHYFDKDYSFRPPWDKPHGYKYEAN